jgi:formylglycine-generating enzyme required for sulfatase activity
MVRLGFVLGLALVSGLHAQLPDHVQRDLIKKDIAAAFREQRWSDLLTHTAKARGLGAPGGELAYFEAKAQVALGRHAAATKSLEVAFRELTPGTPQYDDALEMYRKAKADAVAAEAARIQAIKDQQAAQARAAAEAKRREQERVRAAAAAKHQAAEQARAAREAEAKKYRGYYLEERSSFKPYRERELRQMTRAVEEKRKGSQGSVSDWLDQDLVYLPPGVYRMGGAGYRLFGDYAKPGDDLSRPGDPVLVRLRRGLWMATTEFTRKHYFTVPGANWLAHGHRSDPEKNELPMTGLTYQEITDTISRLNRESQRAGWLPKGWAYRLPSEMEWEYALRGPPSTLGSNSFRASWHAGNSSGLQRVAGKKRNGWGLYDMIGNAAELVADPWHPTFQGRPRDQSIWVTSARLQEGRWVRTLRGGSYRHELKPWRGRQGVPDQELAQPWIGFRLVLAPKD